MARWQLDGAASTFGETHASPTTSAELAARARVGSALRGGAIGGGIGTIAHGAVRNPLYRAQSDGWWTIDNERVVASVSLTRTRPLIDLPANLMLASPIISYVDVGANWRHDAGGLSLGAGGGVRGQNGASRSTSGWGVLDAAAWLAPRLAVVVGAGRTLDDVARGVPHATFVSVALRVAVQPHITLFERRAPVAGPRIVAERLSDDLRRIDVRIDSASHVEIMGDFTNWAPVALDRAGGNWRLDRAISPGSHRVAIRIDGGPWIVPVNLPRVEDDVAGVVGIITIP